MTWVIIFIAFLRVHHPFKLFQLLHMVIIALLEISILEIIPKKEEGFTPTRGL
jgi:hypothetical protein